MSVMHANKDIIELDAGKPVLNVLDPDYLPELREVLRKTLSL